MARSAIFVILIGLIGCAPKAPLVTDMTAISPTDLTAAASVKVFTTEQPPPKAERTIAPVTAYSCKNSTTGAPPSKGDALLQLQLRAVQSGANGLINVTFDSAVHGDSGPDCWQTVQASGIAVRIKD
jgi:hypothetical protein